MIESSPRVDHPSFPVFRVELRGDRSAVIHPENGQITLAQPPERLTQPPEHAQSPPPAVTRRKPSARTLARDQLYKRGLPGKSILGDYFQENMTSRRPFLLLRISFPGRPIFIQLPPALWRECGRRQRDGGHRPRGEGHVGVGGVGRRRGQVRAPPEGHVRLGSHATGAFELLLLYCRMLCSFFWELGFKFQNPFTSRHYNFNDVIIGGDKPQNSKNNYSIGQEGVVPGCKNCALNLCEWPIGCLPAG